MSGRCVFSSEVQGPVPPLLTSQDCHTCRWACFGILNSSFQLECAQRREILKVRGLPPTSRGKRLRSWGEKTGEELVAMSAVWRSSEAREVAARWSNTQRYTGEVCLHLTVSFLSSLAQSGSSCFGTQEAPCSWTFHMNFRKPFVKNVLKDVCGLDLD